MARPKFLLVLIVCAFGLYHSVIDTNYLALSQRELPATTASPASIESSASPGSNSYRNNSSRWTDKTDKTDKTDTTNTWDNDNELLSCHPNPDPRHKKKHTNQTDHIYNSSAPQFWSNHQCYHNTHDQVLFFHVGKAGGGTVCSIMEQINRIAMRKSHPFPIGPLVERLQEGPARTLVLNVRDPVDRFVSAFHWQSLVLCHPNDTRKPHRIFWPKPHERCKGGSHAKREERMLRERYGFDPNRIAEGLCERDPTSPHNQQYQRASRDFFEIGHSTPLVEWLEFLIDRRMRREITSEGIQKLMVLPMEKRVIGGNAGNGSHGGNSTGSGKSENGTGSTMLFEQHIDRASMEILRNHLGDATAKLLMQHRPEDIIERTLASGKGKHSSVVSPTNQTSPSNETTPSNQTNQTTPTTPTKETQSSQSSQSTQSSQSSQSSIPPFPPNPPIPLEPLGECCLARFLEEDYRLIRTMIGDIGDIGDKGDKGDNGDNRDNRDNEDIDANDANSSFNSFNSFNSYNTVKPLQHAHPLLSTACLWGDEAQQFECLADLKSILSRRAMYLDRSRGSCVDVVKMLG